ncbi:MAG: DUF262 domain-containing protein [Candidatus Nanopelagicales bacterium]
MEKKFTSDEVPLSQLLSEARIGKLQLPDFQRGWVWDDEHISSLLASVSVSYPIGAVMTLQRGNPDVKFRPRPLEGVDLARDVEPELLLMDGQQRMTSLYLALASGRPVETVDAKNKPLKRNYYADINAFLDPALDHEDAIVSVPADGLIRSFHNEIKLDISDRAKEIQNEMFPLGIVLDQAETMNWFLQYLGEGSGEDQERREKWTAFNAMVVNSFVQYQVPTIELVKSTPKEAVCQVFEKVNTGGVSLTVFELLTATYAVDDFNLRDDWRARKDEFAVYRVLDQFRSTDFLQVITLLTTLDRRRASDARDSRERVAVSCKRKDVLRLPLADYEKYADAATRAALEAARFMHGEHIFTARDLPYATQLVPLVAILAASGVDAENLGIRQKLRRWYWSGVFGEMYGSAVETRFAFDLPEVLEWIAGSDATPRTVADAQFQSDRLLTLRSRQSAAYKGLFALQMKRGARDFRTGNSIDVHTYFDGAIDVHHIFPKKWCEDAGIEYRFVDSVVNKTAIDSKTNRTIGGHAPSTYTERLEHSAEIDPMELDAILRSHDIDPLALREDDFRTYFNRRFERLVRQIEEAMGKPANRNVDEELPIPDPAADLISLERQLRTQMTAGESKTIEYKSTGRKNLHTGQKDAVMEWNVVKSICGLMNANGGSLLVGVADDGTPVGIEQDFPYLRKQDKDGWELWLTDLITETLGRVAAADLDVAIADIDGFGIARIDVGPSPEPVFARAKGDKTGRFYVRVNNSTLEVSGSELLSYKDKRWPR